MNIGAGQAPCQRFRGVFQSFGADFVSAGGTGTGIGVGGPCGYAPGGIGAPGG